MKSFIQNKKILTFLITMQESFIAVLPFFILSGILTFIDTALRHFNLNLFFITPKMFNLFTLNIQSFTSLVPTISIAYFFAKRNRVLEIISILLALTSLLAIFFYKQRTFPIVLPYGFTLQTVIIPIISTYLLKIFYPKFSLNIKIIDSYHYVYRVFNYIFVFFIAFFATIFIYMFIDTLINFIIIRHNPLQMHLPKLILLYIRNILVQIFWFFGIHGEHIVNALFGKNILFQQMAPNLTYGEFQRIFVNIGGSGAGIAMLIAILLTVKNETIRKIVYITSFLTVFNINTILIFLVIVFNRFLFIPFIIIPLINITLAYFAIHLLHISFLPYHIVWTTPAFIDSFLKTNNIWVSLIQLLLIIIDTAVYTYFIKKFFNYQSFSNHAYILEQNLELTQELKAKEDIKAFQANKELIDANIKVREIINNLNKDNLLIFYQPKIDINLKKAKKFEALIRYNDSGAVKGPFFLDIIEKAGLAPIIDIWVCKQVKKDLSKFRQNSVNPIISVNLHPDTLKSDDAVEKIIKILKHENIIFEIIERSFINRQATLNIKRLKANSFKISVDDYGVGYSSLDTLIKNNINELKLDKSLIDNIETKKGYLICKYTVNLCKELNIKVVAEGVETNSQLNILKNLHVDLIQGYIFSPAIPLKQAINFAKNFSLNGF